MVRTLPASYPVLRVAEPQWLSIGEASAYTGVAVATLKRNRDRGEVSVYRNRGGGRACALLEAGERAADAWLGSAR